MCVHIISNKRRKMQIIFTMVYYDIADKGYLVHDDTRIASHFMFAQSYKHSKSADLLRKSLLSHVWRVPSSKALSCKHERLFDLLTLASSYYLRAENRRNRFSALLYYLPVSRFIPKSFSTEISTPFFLSFSL